MRHRILILILLILPRVHADVPDCATLLTRGPGAVPTEQRREIALRVDETAAEIDGTAGALTGAIRDLVEDRALSPARVNHLFAKPVLGEYSNIVLRYVVAELRARGYPKDRAGYFLLNFTRAFSAEQRVEFACAVLMRMLATINDDVPTSTPKGLDHFEAAVRGFGVTEDGYARFLDVWRILRETPLNVVVRYVLAHVRAAAAAVEHDVKTRTRRPAATDAFSIGSWFRPEPPWVKAPVDPTEVSAALIDDLSVPDFVRDDEALRLTPPPPPSLFDRFLASPDESLVERAALAPPIAREFWLAFAVERANPAVLASIGDGRLLAEVGDSLRARVLELSETFVRLTSLSRALRARAEFEAELAARPKVVDHAVVRHLSEVIARRLNPPDQRGDALIGAELSGAITEAFDDARAHGLDVGTPEFLSVARRAFELSLAAGRTRVTMAALHALMQISRNFPIETAERERLMRDFAMPVFKSKDERHHPLGEFTYAKPLLVADEWGARAGGATHAGVRMISPAVRALLGDVRAVLPVGERDQRTDRDLLKALGVHW